MKNICFDKNLSRVIWIHPLKIDVKTSIASTFRSIKLFTKTIIFIVFTSRILSVMILYCVFWLYYCYLLILYSVTGFILYFCTIVDECVNSFTTFIPWSLLLHLLGFWRQSWYLKGMICNVYGQFSFFKCPVEVRIFVLADKRSSWTRQSYIFHGQPIISGKMVANQRDLGFPSTIFYITNINS